MKAAVWHGPQDMRIEDVEKPVCGENDIVLNVKACGVCGSDLHYYKVGGALIEPPAVLGHEFSGEVLEVGSKVTEIKVGDRVTALGVEACQRIT